MKEYGPCPFGASTLAAFRKWFSEEDMAAILEASIPQPEEDRIHRRPSAMCTEKRNMR